MDNCSEDIENGFDDCEDIVALLTARNLVSPSVIQKIYDGWSGESDERTSPPVLRRQTGVAHKKIMLRCGDDVIGVCWLCVSS